MYYVLLCIIMYYYNMNYCDYDYDYASPEMD